MTNDRSSPLVSVVIPTHNRSSLLGRAVRSVLNQTYTNLECIVVNDASTDDTQDVVSTFLSDPRVVSIRHETNRRGSATRNTGMARARGELIALLDDDDEWLPEKLAKQVDLMLHSPADVGLVYCWMDYYGADGSIVERHHPENRGDVFELMLDANAVGGCPTILLRREVIEEVGGFNEALTIYDDWEFLMRVTKRYKVDLVPEVLVRVDYGHGMPQTSTIDYDDRKACAQLAAAAQAKLDVIGQDKAEYRRYVSACYGLLGYLYGRLGRRLMSLGCFARAFYWCPGDTGTFRFLARLMKRTLTGPRLSGATAFREHADE